MEQLWWVPTIQPESPYHIMVGNKIYNENIERSTKLGERNPMGD